MAFSKTFPRTVQGSNYPLWEEIFLSKEEELHEEQRCRNNNLALMKECLNDARQIIKEANMNDSQNDIIQLAAQMFEKRASHTVHWKENRCKEKFEKLFVKNNGI